MELPLYDDHLHLSPAGRNIDALREFRAAGGTGLTLVNLPYAEVQVSEAEDFRRQYRITAGFASQARDLGLRVHTAVGPYPILLIHLAEHLGLERAESIMVEGMDIAASMVASGEADLIGEVGRPHFPCDRKYVDACNRVLQHGMDLAADIGCPVMIHCETDDDTFSSLAHMADSAGLPRKMVIKHSSPAASRGDSTCGLSVSVPASRTLLRGSLSAGGVFMAETDYIDDPARPGAIMSVTTVPKRIKGLYSSGEMSEEDVIRVCQDIPDELYARRR